LGIDCAWLAVLASRMPLQIIHVAVAVRMPRRIASSHFTIDFAFVGIRRE